MLNRLETALTLLGEHPRMGRPRGDWMPDARSFVVGKYLILYRPRADGILLLRALHGARNLARTTSGR